MMPQPVIQASKLVNLIVSASNYLQAIIHTSVDLLTITVVMWLTV